MNIENLKVHSDNLINRCCLDNFKFNTTEDLKPLKGIIGQERAAYAMDFGLKMKKKGYNIYVAGLSGSGRTSYTYSLIENIAKYKRNNKDFVYVYNFKVPNEPIAISFDAGVGKEFKKDIEEVTEKLQIEMSKMFESEEYELKHEELMENYEEQIQTLLSTINKFAKERGFLFQITQKGLISTPLNETGNVMSDEEYKKLNQEKLKELREKSNDLNKEVHEYFDKLKECEEKFRENLNNLDKKVAEITINFYIESLIKKYGYSEKILTYLHDMKEDMIENISKFKKNEDETSNMFGFLQKDESKFFCKIQSEFIYR